MRKFKSRFHTIITPLVLVLINLILKIRYVSYPSLAKDEPFSVYYSQFDITTIIFELSQGNNPPLYEIFLHIWTNVFGISEFSVRLPSVLFSSLTVYFIYKICQKFFSLKAAFLAAILFTLSNYQMYFAHEARVYSLFMLLTSISMFQYLKLLTSKGSKTDVTTYLIINIFLLYSHFFSWFVIIIQISFFFTLYWNTKKKLINFSKYVGIIGLFYLPYVGVFIKRFLDSSGGTWVEPVSNLRPIHSFYGVLVNNTHVTYVVILILVWIFLQKYIYEHFQKNLLKVSFIILSIVFILISLSIRLPLFQFENDFSSTLLITSFLIFYIFFFTHYLSIKTHSIQGKLVLSWFFIPGILMFTASFIIPMFIDRYLIYLTPTFFILISIAISKLDNKLFLSLSSLTILLMAFSFTPISNNERDVKTLVNSVKSMQNDYNSATFICPDYHGLAFTYYYNKDYFSSKKSGVPQKDLVNELNSDNIFLVKSYRTVDSIYNANNYDKIIYVDAAADFSYPHNNIKNYLKNKFQDESVIIDSLHVPGVYNVYSYQFDN